MCDDDAGHDGANFVDFPGMNEALAEDELLGRDAVPARVGRALSKPRLGNVAGPVCVFDRQARVALEEGVGLLAVARALCEID